MGDSLRRKRWKLSLYIALGVLAMTGGAALSQRTALRGRYYAYRLERAPESERREWADKLVGMGEAAVPRLLACLRKDDGPLCETARESLAKLLAAWTPKDPRSQRLADRFFEEQPSFSTAGQIAGLQVLPEILNSENVETASKARTIVSAALKEKMPELRFYGISLASRAELNLLPAVVPLLDDPDAGVRRAAMLVLGPIREGNGGAEQPLVSTDDLLRWLHDPDPEVRDICEMSLRSLPPLGRGLSDRDIRLGRRVTSPDALDRIKLAADLPYDVNVKAWLRRLSEDPDAAVRAAAARVAAERRVDFVDRLEQMKESDPDESVRNIAGYYRRQYR
jgi:HEAT repeat protein